MTVKIRPSQFVLTYGPGAILETRDGPRLILNAYDGLFFRRDVSNVDLRIIDERMSSILFNNGTEPVELLRLPSNTDRGVHKIMYRTKPFPVWKLCVASEHGSRYVLHQTDRCPKCNSEQSGAVRYVTACVDGHLDEVDWHYVTHKANSKCPKGRKNYFYWTDGDTIAKTKLECPKCHVASNLWNEYYNGLKCTGRHPQDEIGNQPERPGCENTAKILQRQALSLRIPETKTLFSLGSAFTDLHKYLSAKNIKRVLKISPRPSSKDDLLSRLEECREPGDNELEKIINEVHNSNGDEVQRAIKDITEQVKQTGPTEGPKFEDLLRSEFRELVDASRNGAPPRRSLSDRSRILFEVARHKIETVNGPGGTKFLITPIKRLRTITVQEGFRRAVSMDENDHPKPVNVGFVSSNNKQTYIGVEFLGEGIFVRLTDDSEEQVIGGVMTDRWTSADASSYKNPYIFRNESTSHVELDPMFVWWHTLSHALIKTVSENAGYAAASIRERIYLDDIDGKKRGGLIIYATQPGNDGTMGSLISMVPHFKSILADAVERAELCSGDPLCKEQEFRNEKINGAACYGCLMNSETSCEHHNMWLDRNVLVENQP